MKRIILRVLWCGSGLLLAPLSACGFTPTPLTSTPADLIVSFAHSSLKPPLCLGTHSQAGALIYLNNIGGTDAKSFVVAVNGIEQAIETGLAAGQQAVVWIDAVNQTWTGIHAIVDSHGQVTESSETNNEYLTVMATLTPPAPCTPTPDH